MKLVIDADIILYQSAVGAQEVIAWDDENKTINADINKAKNTFRKTIKEYQKFTGVDPFVLCFTSPTNFRKQIWPEYKANRSAADRPVLLKPLKDWAFEVYPCMMVDQLEADDLLGIMATKHPGEVIICSMDKDLKGTPGKLMKVGVKGKHEMLEISHEEAKAFHFIQTMTGDGCDGYYGIHGIGPKKAQKYLDKYGNRWEAVVQCYLDNNKTEEEALQNARMAKILDIHHYKDGEIKVWEPNRNE